MPDAERGDAAGATFAREAALLRETVREAGALALSLFRTELRRWTKGASSPVSEADIAVNDLIRDKLQRVSPDTAWLSEESADDLARLRAEAVWIVDPIDGTRSYLAGRNDWCVSAALVAQGAPVAAAVFAPATEEYFFAARGQGATLNDAALRVTAGDSFDWSRMAGPKPLMQRLEKGALAPYPRISSLALRLCRVADRTLDAAFAGASSNDWDIAAADLIVHEAGGRMTSLAGDAIVYNRADVTHPVLLAAGRDRHARLVERFRGVS